MRIHSDLADTIGNTPLLKLKRASEMTGCTILGKCEFLNPGQSVKDRAALYIIRDAIARGALKPGGTIVEGTAGNTGIGLALVGASMGFRTVIVIPETQSQEKKDALRLLGAELVEVPAVPYKNPNNYVKLSGRLAEQLARCVHQHAADRRIGRADETRLFSQRERAAHAGIGGGQFHGGGCDGRPVDYRECAGAAPCALLCVGLAACPQFQIKSAASA